MDTGRGTGRCGHHPLPLETITGARSDRESDTYHEALSIAQRDGLLLIANHYEYADSELVDDFTRWCRHVTAGSDDDPRWLPAGPDTGFDHPQDACDDLAARLTIAQHILPACTHSTLDKVRGECRPCQIRHDLTHLITALTHGDIDVEHRDLRDQLAIDPDTPVTYSTTTNPATDRPDNPHRPCDGMTGRHTHHDSSASDVYPNRPDPAEGIHSRP